MEPNQPQERTPSSLFSSDRRSISVTCSNLSSGPPQKPAKNSGQGSSAPCGSGSYLSEHAAVFDSLIELWKLHPLFKGDLFKIQKYKKPYFFCQQVNDLIKEHRKRTFSDLEEFRRELIEPINATFGDSVFQLKENLNNKHQSIRCTVKHC